MTIEPRILTAQKHSKVASNSILISTSESPVTNSTEISVSQECAQITIMT